MPNMSSRMIIKNGYYFSSSPLTISFLFQGYNFSLSLPFQWFCYIAINFPFIHFLPPSIKTHRSLELLGKGSHHGYSPFHSHTLQASQIPLQILHEAPFHIFWDQETSYKFRCQDASPAFFSWVSQNHLLFGFLQSAPLPLERASP